MGHRLIGLALLAAPAGAAAQSVEPQVSGTTARFQAVSVVDSTTAWASGTRGSYLVTSDGGLNWRVGQVPGADSLEFRDVHAFDAKRAVLLAAGPGDKSRLYHTADGGLSWREVFRNADPVAFYDCIDFAGPIGVAVSDAVAGRFPLLRSTDHGATWTAWSPPGPAIAAIEGEGAFAASGTCLTMRPDGSAWVGTAKGGRVIRFGPPGSRATETPIIRNLPTAGIASLAFLDDRFGIAVGGDLAQPEGFTDNVIVTTDGGTSWRLAGRPPIPGSIYGVAFVPGRGRTVVAVSPKGAVWSPDGGNSWRRLAEGDYWGVGFGPDGTGWIVGAAGRIGRVRFAR
ncbi:MAG: oxidoreductase [Gemmatimonadetes bacterium]|nr:oxidoreductase [Gemmatimonadota bacterium]